jgi:hypothetical protein
MTRTIRDLQNQFSEYGLDVRHPERYKNLSSKLSIHNLVTNSIHHLTGRQVLDRIESGFYQEVDPFANVPLSESPPSQLNSMDRFAAQINIPGYESEPDENKMLALQAATRMIQPHLSELE